MKVEKRLEQSLARTVYVTALSILFVLVVVGILLSLVGANPIQTYVVMFRGAFGSTYALTETLVKAIPLMLTGFAVLLAFRAKFYNIGAEGQLFIGAAAAVGVALYRGETLPDALKLPVFFTAAFVAGALWGVIPALLKVRLGINEVFTTLMLNYIAILGVEHLYYGPWSDPGAFGFGGTAMIAKEFWLPKLSGRLHTGIFIALGIALLLTFLLNKTPWGYEVAVVGDNPKAARYAGINVVKTILVVAAISGGLAGIAGAVEVAGVVHRLQKGLTVGYGFTAIIIVVLARLGPIRTVIVSVLLAGLLVGGDQLQLTMKLPAAVAVLLQGALFLSVLAGEFFIRYKLTFPRLRLPKREEGAWIRQ